ncbi:MAG: HAMP domain-containing sensor histidine kinase [Turicibacter sp.]|nr:HAMP domain-containing sensor histidine kinase [Turicibacter sp.]
MSRNKEFFIFMSIQFILMCLVTIVCLIVNVRLGLFVLGMQVLMWIAFFMYHRWRYIQIAKLSETLRRVSLGHYELEIRDNQEGELSILKSELYKVTLRLKEANELLEQETQYLADAMSDISHQLKTPLTSIRMMNELLADPNLDEQTRLMFISQNKTQLDRLQWLVSSLLKFAKLDTKTADFKQEILSVKTLIQHAIEPLMIPLEIKEQQFIVQGDECKIVGDFQWTVEALTNIFKNAIEHTPVCGTIQVNIQENPIYTEITIKDNGEGIDKEDLPYLFKRFYRGKNANRDSVGIGLAMAKSIINEQNGDILVESILGEGTTFKLKFYKLIV